MTTVTGMYCTAGFLVKKYEGQLTHNILTIWRKNNKIRTTLLPCSSKKLLYNREDVEKLMDKMPHKTDDGYMVSER